MPRRASWRKPEGDAAPSRRVKTRGLTPPGSPVLYICRPTFACRLKTCRHCKATHRRPKRRRSIAAYFNQDRRIRFAAQTETMVIERDNAGMAGLNHPYIDTRSQSHFVQSQDKRITPADIEHTAGLTGMEQMQWNDVSQGATSQTFSD
jgi:hypothetical protein